VNPILNKAGRVFLYGAVPAAALVAGSPVGLSVWEAQAPSLDLLLLAAPFYLGILAAPGYVHLAYSGASAHSAGAVRRWWIRASLLAALVAAAGGVWGGTVIFFLLPPSIVTGIAVVVLWRAFERGPGAAGASGPLPRHRPG
jgi:hypothetical protein